MSCQYLLEKTSRFLRKSLVFRGNMPDSVDKFDTYCYNQRVGCNKFVIF